MIFKSDVTSFLILNLDQFQLLLTPNKVNGPHQNSQVCQTVIDLHEDTVVTENCEEVITTTCTQVSQVRLDHNMAMRLKMKKDTK